jgi:hypothetical protein
VLVDVAEPLASTTTATPVSHRNDVTAGRLPIADFAWWQRDGDNYRAVKHQPAFRRLATGVSPRDSAILAWLSSKDDSDAPNEESAKAGVPTDTSTDWGTIDNAFDVLDKEFEALVGANR